MKSLLFLIALISLGKAFPSNKPEKLATLIVGGKDASQGEVPYQLGVKFYGEQHCGASIVVVNGLTVAITAAHCVPSVLPVEAFTVVAGDLSLSEGSGIEQTRQVTRIVVHEGYEFYTYKHDIALLFIDEPFEFNDNVQPIALPDDGAHTSGDLFVSGWGRLSHEGSKPDVLQTVELPIVDNDICQAAYDELGDEIFDTFLCAGQLGLGGKDACQGDSGGPAKSLEGNYLAGVVSWGEGCADPRYPGIYTEMSHYIGWINSQVETYRLGAGKPHK